MKKKFLDYSLIALGSLLLAAALNLFLAPNKISSGGVSSIGTVLLHLFGVPLSVTNMAFNIVLFLLGYRFLGKGAVFKTVAGVVLLSLFLQLTAYFPAYTGDPLVATLLGGLLMGTGVGLVVRQGASTGGSDLAAMILHRFAPHISIAMFILIIDCAIIIGAALVFRSITVAGYSLLSLAVASRLTDGLLTLGHSAKAVQIFSKKHAAISAAIMTRLERGVTGLHSRGLYSREEGLTLLCVVSPKQLPKLIALIKETDPAAFIVVTDAREVLGEGFQLHTGV